jgi:hypothetical protein
MYPPSVRGHAFSGAAETERPAASYYTSHDPASQSGWQSLYANGSNIRFSANMLPPNARGYSAAPHVSATAIMPTGTGSAAARLRSQWIARAESADRDRDRHHFRGEVGRGFGESFCGPHLGFGFCGNSFSYGFYGAGFGCIGGSYWDASNWAGAPALLNLSPCIALGYEPDENQVSSDESPYGPDYWPAPDAAPADTNLPPDTSATEGAQENVNPAPVVTDQRPETLLQLKDGSMYGLTQYWVAGGLLNYITDYGGRNAIPFDRIDIGKSVQLNSQRGVPFVLQTNPDAH